MIMNAKSIAIVLGLSLCTSQRRLTLIKGAFAKSRMQKVTIYEFCEYENQKIDFVKEKLGLK